MALPLRRVAYQLISCLLIYLLPVLQKVGLLVSSLLTNIFWIMFARLIAQFYCFFLLQVPSPPLFYNNSPRGPRPPQVEVFLILFRQTHHSRQDTSGRGVDPSQRSLPDNTQSTHKRRTSMIQAGFERAISATDQSRNIALDLSATGIDKTSFWQYIFPHMFITLTSKFCIGYYTGEIMYHNQPVGWYGLGAKAIKVSVIVAHTRCRRIRLFSGNCGPTSSVCRFTTMAAIKTINLFLYALVTRLFI